MSVGGYLIDIFDNPEKYLKFWVAAATALLNLLTTYFPDQQWLPVLISFAGAFGVFAVPNKK